MANKKKPKPKTKTLRGYGHINVSNVNSENSECITLTYSTSNIKSMKDIPVLEKEFDDLIDEELLFDLEVIGHNTTEPKIKLKAKVKTCDNEDRGHEISSIFDKHIKKKGGQTTLDEGLEGGKE